MVSVKQEPIEYIADERGFDIQSIVCMEECAELIKAISKYRRKPSDKRLINIVSELADVHIMCEQVLYLLDEDGHTLHEKYEQAIREKTNREIKRIKEAKNG